MRRKLNISLANPIYLLVHVIVFVVGVLLIVVSQLPNLSPTGSAIWVGVGSSLVAAGVTGWVVYVYVRTHNQLGSAVEMLSRFGFVKAFSGRSIKIREEYDDRMRRFSKCADIIGFGLNSLRQDNLASFRKWKLQGRIRILLIDPEFPSINESYAVQRDREENEPDGTIASHVANFVSDTADIVEPGRFEIRLYRCLPMLNMYRIDDEIMWGPYLIQEQSRNTPTFLVRSGGEMFSRLAKNFQRIWSSDTLSREVPPEWVQRDATPQSQETGPSE